MAATWRLINHQAIGAVSGFVLGLPTITASRASAALLFSIAAAAPLSWVALKRCSRWQLLVLQHGQ